MDMMFIFGNEKLMNKIGVDITEKHPEGTVVYMAIDNQYAGMYCDF